MSDTVDLTALERLRELSSAVPDRSASANVWNDYHARVLEYEEAAVNAIPALISMARQQEGLKAENARSEVVITALRAQSSQQSALHAKVEARALAAEAQRDELKAENERLKAALKPFAAAFHHANPASMPSDQAQVMRSRVGTAHFKRTASVLSTVEKG